MLASATKSDKRFLSGEEHRLSACVPSGHSVRFFGFSGLQVRWAHRLKAYVPFLLDALLRGSTNLPHANPYRAQWTENGAFLPRGSQPATGGGNTEPFRSGLV